MKVKVIWIKVYDYVCYDLKEIAFPSSLPDPSHIKKRRKLTLKGKFLVLKEASRLYAASYVRDVGPELRPNDHTTSAKSEDETNGEKTATNDKEPSTLEDLAVAARGGMETLRPALQRVYMTRASAYKDALMGLVKGIKKVHKKSWRKRQKMMNFKGKMMTKKSQLDRYRYLLIFDGPRNLNCLNSCLFGELDTR